MKFISQFYKHPTSTYQAGSFSYLQTGIAFVFIFILLLCPLFLNSFSSYKAVEPDLQAISNQLPSFKVQNGQIHSEEEQAGFLYQADHFLFVFDPDGEMSHKELEKK